MMDWDDVRYFLAVACGGSVRAAAERLGVNHSTVLRRVAQLEERLGAHVLVSVRQVKRPSFAWLGDPVRRRQGIGRHPT